MESRPRHIDAVLVAEKLAKIAQLLRRRGEPDAIQKALRSVHTNPCGIHGWKVLGHMVAQDGRWGAARHAFEAAIALDPSDGVASRVGLATILAQQGVPGEAAELLATAMASASPGVANSLTEPYERLCRQLMPAHRMVAIQSDRRRDAWAQAIARTCKDATVLDISTNQLPMLLASRVGALPVMRVETLPRRVALELLAANSLRSPADVVLLPPEDTKEQGRLVGRYADVASENWVLLADMDGADLLGSKYLSGVCR